MRLCGRELFPDSSSTRDAWADLAVASVPPESWPRDSYAAAEPNSLAWALAAEAGEHGRERCRAARPVTWAEGGTYQRVGAYSGGSPPHAACRVPPRAA
jgi:hypothetical protein